MPLQDDLARRITVYRDEAGLSQDELAREVGIDRTAMTKIESGSRRVSALELHRLADALNVRLEWFFSDPPGAVSDYRTSAPSQVTAGIDRELERLTREAEFVHRLSGSHWVELQIIAAGSDDPERLAATVRATADCGAEPIRSMARLAGKLGILLFTPDLGKDAPDGASSPSDRFGIAIVNSQRDVGRRRLTAGHEIGHLIGGDRYRVDWRVDEPDQEHRESFLDRFARALLLPADAMEAVWSSAGSDGFSERNQALRDASHWQVDMSTLATRLYSLKLVDSAAEARIRGYRPGRPDFVELGLVKRDDLEPGSLPELYERAVLKLYRAEDISASRALDLLLGAYEEADLPEAGTAFEDPVGSAGGVGVEQARQEALQDELAAQFAQVAAVAGSALLEGSAQGRGEGLRCAVSGHRL